MDYLKEFTYCLSALFTVVYGLVSCSTYDDVVIKERKSRLHFSSFGFFKDNNPSLMSDYVLNDIKDDTLSFFIHELSDATALIPQYTGNFKIVTQGGAVLESGKTKQDYSTILKYYFEGLDGMIDSCFVKVLIGNGIPRIDIITENNAEIVSKQDYINATIRISNNPEVGIIKDDHLRIRGRGNASWNHPKKSFKIKFSEKQRPFGFPANKDWVLLGNYTDRSLLRTSYMCEVSRALDIKYTVNVQHVDLFLNGDYQGTYLFSDHIEKGQKRVNINDDGFFIEGDNYYQYEPLFFVTDSFKIGMTFKYPDPDKGQIKEGDEIFCFIQDYMNRVEKAMMDIPNGGRDYLGLIDSRSFAKFIIAEEVLANFDSNFYYILSTKDSKLEMYPLWDFEWSLGLGEIDEKGWVARPATPRVDVTYWDWIYPYTMYLYHDPAFVALLQEEWVRLKSHLEEIKINISSIKEFLRYSQKDNFEKWPILNTYVSKELVVLGGWEKEVDYINDFFDKRTQWFDNYIMNELPIKYNK